MSSYITDSAYNMATGLCRHVVTCRDCRVDIRAVHWEDQTCAERDQEVAFEHERRSHECR